MKDILNNERTRTDLNIWHDIAKERISPTDFIAVIEIPKGIKNKYELDKDTGLLYLDRVLSTSTHYPANYGFIPRTYAEDKDPLDVLVLCQERIDSMALVRCYPIGVLKMIDEEEIDEKIIAIPFKDPSLSMHKNISDLPPHIFNEISHFFMVYKFLENKTTAMREVCGRDEAIRVIEGCMKRYQDIMKK